MIWTYVSPESRNRKCFFKNFIAIIIIDQVFDSLRKMHDHLVEEYRKLAGMSWYRELASQSKNFKLPEVQGDEVAIELE